ncbi:MAG: HD domain-containing protein [Prevotella sp.]
MEGEITFSDVRSSKEIVTYIRRADLSLQRMGYTEHSLAHVTKVATIAGNLIHELGYDAHTEDLTRIAGFMHDIGNVVNRIDHAQSGAIMSFRILDKMGMSYEDIAKVIAAIGNHDETTAWPVNEVAAALILADKSDVRRTRVRGNSDCREIHYRVNYAVTHNNTHYDSEGKTFILDLTVDTGISSVMEYFEIFMSRMKLCVKAAEYLGLQFSLVINGTRLC